MVLHEMFSSMKRDQTNLRKCLDELLFPRAAQTLQALIGNFLFPLAGIHVGSRCFKSPDHLLGGSLRRCSPCTPRGRAGQMSLWFLKAFIIVIHYPVSGHWQQKLITLHLCLWTEDVVDSKGVEKSTVYKGQHYFFFVHFTVFLRM